LFLGHRSDVPELLACCDLSVLPSEAEALPNSLLEAIAAVSPSWHVRGGIPEIIMDGVNGLLVPPKIRRPSQKQFCAYYKTHTLRKSFRRAARMVRTHFGFDRLLANSSNSTLRRKLRTDSICRLAC